MFEMSRNCGLLVLNGIFYNRAKLFLFLSPNLQPVELQNTTTTAATTSTTATAVKPPLPPKGEASTTGPLAPPRRNKRPGSFLFPSPLLGRKQDQDQVRCCSIS